MHVLIQGAGRGIGLSLAQQARASGATKLFLTARNPQESPGYVSLPPDANTIWMKLDATRPETIADTAAIVADNTDRLDRVICTAGILQEGTIRPEKRIQDIDAATLTLSFRQMRWCLCCWPAKYGRCCGAHISCISRRCQRGSDRSATITLGDGMPIAPARPR